MVRRETLEVTQILTSIRLINLFYSIKHMKKETKVKLPKGLELPKTISTSLTSNKPSAELKQLKIDDNFILRYVGIRTGGIEFEARGKTLEKATTEMWKQLRPKGIIIYE